MVTFETWLFQNLPQYFKENDSYKNSGGSGLLERFIGELGKDFDTYIIPKIEDFLSIHASLTTDDIYVAYIAWALGNPPDTFTHYVGHEEDYRQVLRYLVDVNKVKGTRQGFDMLFGLLGVTVNLTEVDTGELYYDT